ncbi:hypothetical protein GQ53DRAFT_747589, partial [Thozetella sp. PMI_491]
MASASPSSRLTQMPVELLLRITYYLTTPELGYVRLTCKALEKSLFNFFSHEFFRKRQFMVLERSLQTLVDISKHQALSPFLRHVIIATDQVEHPVFGGSEDQLWCLEMAHADQTALLTTGTARDMLAEAFRHLPNLETIDLRDFNSNTRNRDGSRWMSYGATTLQRETGHATKMWQGTAGNRLAYPSELYAIVVSALAASGLQPPNLEVVLRQQQWGISDNAMAIPKAMEPSLAPVLAGLKKLHLTLDLKVDRPNPISNIAGIKINNSPFTRAFLSHCPNVTWLRLNFRGQDMAGPGHPNLDFLDWLGTPVPDALASSATPNDNNRNPPPVALASLEKLDFGFLSVDVPLILRIVKKFTPTLKALTLYKIILQASTLAASDPDSDKLTNLWERLFKGLSRATQRGLSLHHLNVAQMSQREARAQTHHSWTPPETVWFQNSENATKEFGREHTGEIEMVKFIEGLVSHVQVATSNLPLQASDEEDEDDEEEFDEDEDDEMDVDQDDDDGNGEDDENGD